MAIPVNDLKPYKSLLLLSVPGGIGLTQLARTICTEVRGEVSAVATKSGVSNPASQAGLSLAYFDYSEKKQVAWTMATKEDQLHHLVVVCRLKRHLAVMMTDSGLREKIHHKVGSQDGSTLGRLRTIDRGTLNAAFVNGKAKTLWLTNTRRSGAAAVDSKILAGEDLQFALDPLGDQSFLFSAVRCQPPAGTYQQAIGMSPRKSAIWAGVSHDFAAFCASVAQLLAMIDTVAAPVTDPLPVLATPLADSASLATVATAYDAAVVPLDMLDAALAADKLAYAERWSHLVFDVTATAGPNLTAALSLPDAAGALQLLGSVDMQFDLTVPERIHVATALLPGAAVHDAATLDEAVTMLNGKHAWLRVWYQSGHSFSDGTFSLARFRDQPFTMKWGNFAGYEITREKPSPLTVANIGGQDSLFCWVKNIWLPQLSGAALATSWLACNDGSREIADFIHLALPAGSRGTLTLLHLKASSTDSPARQISLGDYELVVSQAAKNLRFLEILRLKNEFTQFLNAKLMNAVWHNGNQVPRNQMTAALQNANPFPDLKVIVVQPRVRRTSATAARQPNAGIAMKRAIGQLDMLLQALSSACRAVNATCEVIGEDV